VGVWGILVVVKRERRGGGRGGAWVSCMGLGSFLQIP